MRTTALTAGLMGSLLLSCVEGETGKVSYEIGETGVLRLTNKSPMPMAVGGCNPQSIEQREPGRWVGAPLIYPACAFGYRPDGSHSLDPSYRMLHPGQTIEIPFNTRFVESEPALIRITQRVSVGCKVPRGPTAPVTCRGFHHFVTDPIPIFEPGTTDTVGH